ncbi:MAG: glycosyltransferase [Halanaeroarchaeum sp.]
MDAVFALAHAPEGAGNATRTLAVAEALEDRGATVELAGGGPGAEFLAMNGYDEYEPTDLDFIDRREGDGGSVFAGLAHAAPRVVARFRDFYGWLDRTDPDVLLTDDPFAALPALVQGVPFFRIDHSSVACYDQPFERLAYRVFNRVSLELGEGFFYTSVHENPYPTREGLRPVGPIAHEPSDPETVEDFDALVVPGTYSTGFEDVAARLEDEGLDVTLVGGDDWEAVPSMTPYSAAADVVVCTGFSSIAEAVVSGTPAVVYPFIDCQEGIAAAIEEAGVPGVEVVDSVEEAVAAATDPPDPPDFDNGADEVADALVSFVAD